MPLSFMLARNVSGKSVLLDFVHVVVPDFRCRTLLRTQLNCSNPDSMNINLAAVHVKHATQAGAAGYRMARVELKRIVIVRASTRQESKFLPSPSRF